MNPRCFLKWRRLRVWICPKIKKYFCASCSLKIKYSERPAGRSSFTHAKLQTQNERRVLLSRTDLEMKLHSWLALFAPSLFQIVRSADFDALDEWGSSPLSSLGHLEVTDSLDAGGPPSPPKQPQVPTDLREVNIMLNARHKAKQIGEDASMVCRDFLF